MANLNSELEIGAISIKNVSKSFKRSGLEPNSYSTIKTKLLEIITGKKKKPEIKSETTSDFYALKNIDLEIKSGSSVALIGRNGSGKSTILKLLAGIYVPDTGSIETSGSISALIELGAGFHPDFTGRENVYLGGIMFGLSRTEIDKKFNDIVKYAELESVIDQPVRTYSSGMYMRLGFSLAIHTNPDILLVDEVLAVGDAHFIHKCQDSISEFKRSGKTLVFVTHDLSSVSRWCDEALWLENGSIKMRGHPREIADYYLLSIRNQENEELQKADIALNLDAENIPHDTEAGSPGDLRSRKWGNKNVTLNEVKLFNGQGEETWTFSKDDSLTLSAQYTLNKETKDLVFGIGLIRIDGLEVFGTNTGFDEDSSKKVKEIIIDTQKKSGSISITLPRLGLTEGTYFIDVACHALDGTPYDYHHRIHKFHVRTNQATHGIIEPVFSWSFDD